MVRVHLRIVVSVIGHGAVFDLQGSTSDATWGYRNVNGYIAPIQSIKQSIVECAICGDYKSGNWVCRISIKNETGLGTEQARGEVFLCSAHKSINALKEYMIDGKTIDLLPQIEYFDVRTYEWENLVRAYIRCFKCNICNGNGKEKCEHGLSEKHQYCSHDKTYKHDT